MTPRQRLEPPELRGQLLTVATRLFAAKPYDDVFVEEIAAQAGISRALLYRYFPSKRDLFTSVYKQASDQLLADTVLDPRKPLLEQLTAGLDTHFDYFAANRNTVLAANRLLVGDPVIQGVITDELAVLRERLLGVTAVGEDCREMVSVALMSWLVFVRTLVVEWLAHEAFSRAQLHDMSVGALLGALGAVLDLEALAAPVQAGPPAVGAR